MPSPHECLTNAESESLENQAGGRRREERGMEGWREMVGGKREGNTYEGDFVTIASTGNAAEFGDLSISHARAGTSSDNHGGLQSS